MNVDSLKKNLNDHQIYDRGFLKVPLRDHKKVLKDHQSYERGFKKSCKGSFEL